MAWACGLRTKTAWNSALDMNVVDEAGLAADEVGILDARNALADGLPVTPEAPPPLIHYALHGLAGCFARFARESGDDRRIVPILVYIPIAVH